jgi:hypothetical protein
MYQGTQGYSLMKKTEGRKSRDTVSLNIVHTVLVMLRLDPRTCTVQYNSRPQMTPFSIIVFLLRQVFFQLQKRGGMEPVVRIPPATIK